MLHRLLLLLSLFAAACKGGVTRDAAAFRGVYVAPPIEKPDFTFTDVNGAPYNFRLATAGKVALLFFGYTHCPDVCPLHAANVAAVLKQMPFDEKGKIQFVFVTTDAERDTPERLKQWLGAFDATFVGLRASPDELHRVQSALGIAAARKEFVPGMDSTKYLVGHAAQVIAFGLDGTARTEYPMGVRQEDWALDLPRLARGEVPQAPTSTPTAGSSSGGPPVPVSGMSEPAIEVRTAIMAAPAGMTEAAVYLVVRNRSATADTLTSVWSPEARQAMLHATVANGGQQVMEMRSAVPIAGGETLTLGPGTLHIMLTTLQRMPAVGESFPLRLRFARAGEYVVAPIVVGYTDVQRQLDAAK